MVRHRVFILVGSLWELVRFFLVLALLLVFLDRAGARAAHAVSWLLASSAGSLLVPVGGLMLSIYPERYANLVQLLRLGMTLQVFCFLLLMSSGPLGGSWALSMVRLGGAEVPQALVLLVVLALDLAFLGSLLAFRH